MTRKLAAVFAFAITAVPTPALAQTLPAGLDDPAYGEYAETVVGGTVPGTLSLALGAAASFGTFAPGVAADYTASTTANVISTAGDGLISVADPSSTATGRLVNGNYALTSPLRAKASSAGGEGSALAP